MTTRFRWLLRVGTVGFTASVQILGQEQAPSRWPRPDEEVCVQFRGNPFVRMWELIRDGLSGSDGDKYWSALKGRPLPKLLGTVLTVSGAGRERVLTVSFGDGVTADAIIRLRFTEMSESIIRATTLEVEPVAVDFQPQPFQLTLEVADAARVAVVGKEERHRGSTCECRTDAEWKKLREKEKARQKQ